MSDRLARVVAALDLRPDRRFDIVFAARVRLFHVEPERAHACVAPWLAAGGSVRSFYDAPAGG